MLPSLMNKSIRTGGAGFKEDEVMATLEIKDMENVSIVPGEKLPFALVQKLGLPEDTTWYDQSA